MANYSSVNLVCAVLEKYEIIEKNIKDKIQYIREIIVVDETGKMKVSLWDNFAQLNFVKGEILTFENLKFIQNFDHFKLST